jgi:hypothetical protein
MVGGMEIGIAVAVVLATAPGAVVAAGAAVGAISFALPPQATSALPIPMISVPAKTVRVLIPAFP